MRRVLRYVTLSLLMAGAVHSQTQIPECYNNYTPPVGHGVKNDDPNQGPRTILNVWADPNLNSNVHQAAVTATNEWNSATNSTGQVMPYFFNIVADRAQADIKIVPGATAHGCANYTRSTQEMNIDNGLADNVAESIADVIAHELGHPLGLRNQSSQPSSSQPTGLPPGTTVMQGFTGDCDMVTDSIRPNDVNQVIRQATDKATCTSSAQVGEELQPIPTATPCLLSCPTIDGSRYKPNSECTGCIEDPDNTPVLIDVLGDGFSLTNAVNGVSFDLNNDGVPEELSWTSVGSDDAWLILDRNGNGLIDDGSELFGNFTPQSSPPSGEERNGFLALAEYDKPPHGGNSDGAITDLDAIFTSLRLWRDINHDGVSEASELFSLQDGGLKILELSYKTSKYVDQYGNRFRYRAKIRDTNGAQAGRWAWDVFLVSAP